MQSNSRLFFALVPPATLARQIALIGNDISKKIMARQVTSEMIHMTLRYIGQTDKSIADCVIEAADSISIPAFTIDLKKTDYRKKPQVIWCEPEYVNKSLNDLVNQLEKNCQQCELLPEQRKFIPHVTLLRKAKTFEVKEDIKLPTWKVNEFVLLASVSVGAAVEYREIKRWKLKN